MENGEVLGIFEVTEGKFKKVYDGDMSHEACEKCFFYDGKNCKKTRKIDLEDGCASELFHWEKMEEDPE